MLNEPQAVPYTPYVSGNREWLITGKEKNVRKRSVQKYFTPKQVGRWWYELPQTVLCDRNLNIVWRTIYHAVRRPQKVTYWPFRNRTEKAILRKLTCKTKRWRHERSYLLRASLDTKGGRVNCCLGSFNTTICSSAGKTVGKYASDTYTYWWRSPVPMVGEPSQRHMLGISEVRPE